MCEEIDLALLKRGDLRGRIGNDLKGQILDRSFAEVVIFKSNKLDAVARVSRNELIRAGTNGR